MSGFDIAFTAQDSKKLDLINLIEKYRDGISQYSIVATMDTGLFIQRMTGFDMGLIDCGSKGGYLQIAKLVTQNELKMVVFLHDPSLSLNEVGVRELLLACIIHNIPFANNVATAEFILHRFLEKEMATHWRCPKILLNHNLISA